MSAAILRFSLLSFLVSLLVGCGGSSGGGGSTGGGGDSNPTTVTFTFSNGTPSVVAAKIGSGSYTLESLASTKLALSIPSGTKNFSVAYACSATALPAPLSNLQFVFEASMADGTEFTLPCPGPSPTNQMGTLTGSADANSVSGANLLNIAVGNGSSVFVSGINPDTNFSFNLPAGNDRVEVLAYNEVTQGFASTTSLVAARNLSNQTVPGALNGGSTVVLGAADETTPESITYSNVPSGYSAPSTSVDCIMGGAGGFTVGTATTQYPALPSGAFLSGDFYEFFASAFNSTNLGEMMIVAKSSSSAGPVSFVFPAPWTYAGPTPAALPSFNFAYTGFSGGSGVYQTALTGWNGASGFTEIEVTATRNYQNGSTTVTFPDLTGLTGFVTTPASGTQVTWVALIAESSLGMPQPMTANSTITTVENAGAYTVP